MRPVPRSLRLLTGMVAGALLTALLVVSPAGATISAGSATNTSTTVSYQFSYTGSPAYLRVYVDTDRNASTGFAQGGTGADYLLENGSLYQHTGSGWSWSLVRSVTFSGTGGVARWTPFDPRTLELVLRNTSTGTNYKLAMSSDPRRWTAGASTTVSQTLTLPASLPAGSYSLLLNLPDPLLSTRPEYSIRLANQGTWDAASGMNSLLHTITVS